MVAYYCSTFLLVLTCTVTIAVWVREQRKSDRTNGDRKFGKVMVGLWLLMLVIGLVKESTTHSHSILKAEQRRLLSDEIVRLTNEVRQRDLGLEVAAKAQAGLEKQVRNLSVRLDENSKSHVTSIDSENRLRETVATLSEQNLDLKQTLNRVSLKNQQIEEAVTEEAARQRTFRFWTFML
ncbi:hypothetical protein [Rhodopirellula baltica]|uniref:Uncharacterized protein n=1 Tax=Rhodopirellula baltica SWK14 TaxID=993516 RepID=L7CKN0_RHOBT|nr:hypothetical protein [Rhodopirellula baltica]ELP34518.1 hypothetical protein RBSWK_01528 [Rhodopirellula baltica SWK14]